MISIKIEKEIKGKNKVLAGLDLRQLVSVAVTIVLCLAVWKISGTTLNEVFISWCVIGLVCCSFGWIEKDGFHMEDLILRYMKQIVYRNSRVLYKTQNEYVSMYNKGTIEHKNKRSKKEIKAEKKKIKKIKKHKSKIKTYY